ncbi:MAG: hypothetical protein KIS67_28280, partial [Verrucomicrobiae bacterium]|nr:hypothetical protein [Verrucomicrobiae bacterium]
HRSTSPARLAPGTPQPSNQGADMKSGVKRQFAQGDAETKKVLATQDDVRTFVPLRSPPGVRR